MAGCFYCLSVVRGRSMVSLAAGLCWQSQSDSVALGFSNDGLHLVNSVGVVLELGHVEASSLDLVLALHLGDLDGLGDADLLWGRVGEGASNLKRVSHKWDLVSLGLVFLMANLVFSAITSMMSITAISSRSTSCNLHGLRLVLIGDLGGGAGSGDIFLLVNIGTDLSVNGDGSFLTDGQNSVEAVVVVNNLLDSQGDWSHLISEGWDTDLSID